MKDFIIKNKNILILVIVAILVFVVAILVKAPSPLKEVSYDEYLNLKKGTATSYFYIGNSDIDKENLTDIARENNISIYYLDSSKLTNSQKEELIGNSTSSLRTYEDDKEMYSFSANEIKTYQIKKDFMDKGYIGKGIIEVSVEEYLEQIKKDEYSFMFIGSATCGWCTQFKPELTNVVNENNIKVYYVDLSKTTDEDREKLFASDKYFTEEEWGTPLSFLYKKGKRVAVLNGYKEKAEVEKFLKDNKAIK